MLICPQCRRKFNSSFFHCPSCKAALLYELSDLESAPSSTEEPGWQSTPWGRIVVGLLLAQGLAHGLRWFLTAGLMAGGEEGGPSAWISSMGQGVWLAVQGISLLLGSALTGAGQKNGLIYGSLVGLVNGLIFLATHRDEQVIFLDVFMYGQPVLHMVLGALGGWIGTLIWKPLPNWELPDSPGSSKTSIKAPVSFSCLAGPIHFTRILVGISIVVAGVIWPNKILAWILEVGQGNLQISSHGQARWIFWEITTLATLLGASVAGANTFNGLKQGLFVGMGASVLLVGIFLANPRSLESLVNTLGSVLAYTMVGGWFGGQLFPPVCNVRRRSISMV